jgi:PadR family transcriptional regulator, regulatory protein PadR
MNNTEMKKGISELLVLTVLSKNECYGYEIISVIKNCGMEISEGSLYSILGKLVNEKLVQTRLEESNQGGIRKYYKLNNFGIQKLKRLNSDFKIIFNTLSKLNKIKHE